MWLRVWLGNRNLRTHYRLGLLCVILPLLVSCGAPAQAKVRIEAYSWWKRASEKNAFQNILNLYNSRHPDADAFIQSPETDADELRVTLTERLLAGAPPSTFQANVGADLMRWSIVDTTDAKLPTSSRIASLAGFYKDQNLLSVLPSELQDALLMGPVKEPFTIPVDIHRLNVIYYNTASLQHFRSKHPGKSFLDLDVLCPANVEALLAQEHAKPEVNIAVGLKDDFALTLFAFESVLPAVAGPKLYSELFRGCAKGDWEARVLNALQCVQYLSRSFLNNDEKNWSDALAQVGKRTADLSVMGDWSNGELKAELDSGAVDSVPFPSVEPTFVFTSDTFPLPLNAPYPEQTMALLATISSSEAQRVFSQEKGSIPARTDVDVRLLGNRAVLTKADFVDDRVSKVLATSGLFPPYYPGDEMTRALRAMTAPGATEDTISVVLGLLKDIEPLLAAWQKRLSGRQDDGPDCP